PRHGLPEGVDDPQRAVAVALPLLAVALDEHAHRGQVVDLVELLPALGHLLVDGVKVLRAEGDVGGDANLVELFLQTLARRLDELLAVGTALVHHRLDLGVLARMERLEREVLELPLDRVNTETMCERRVDLERLPRLLQLLLLAQVLDRPHVVEAVGELDEDDVGVLRHRDDHLALVLRLGLLAALELDPCQLRDALHEDGDVVSELRTDLLDRRRSVLDDVMDERRGKRRLVTSELGEDLGHTDRVEHEVLPAPPLLSFVRPTGEAIRPLEQVPVDLGVVLLDLREQLLERLVMPLGGSRQNRIRHEPILARGLSGTLYAASGIGSFKAALNVSDSTSERHGPPSATPSSVKTARPNSDHASGPAFHSATRARRRSSKRSGVSKMRLTRSCGETVPFQWFAASLNVTS